MLGVAMLLMVGCAERDDAREDRQERIDDREDELANRDPENGEALYGSTGCDVCHGANGAGGAGPALSDIAAELADDEIADAIENGTDGGMPPAGDALTDDEIGDLVAYIRQEF